MRTTQEDFGPGPLAGTNVVVLLCCGALASFSGCRDKSALQPVGEPAARVWSETIDLPVMKLRIALAKGRELVRDDGLFRGDLALHSKQLAAEPEGRGLTTVGRPEEGLMASGTGADGIRRVVVWAATTGDPAGDRARREGLRAAAAIRLGHRAEIEAAFESRGLRTQMRTVSNDVLVALVELYALHLQGSSYHWPKGPEREQAAQILMALGVGEK
jgi:hypothetical protein